MKLQVAVNGKSYEVEVEIAEEDDPRMSTAYVPPQPSSSGKNAPPPAAALQAGGAATEVVADEAKVCRSPIAGVVIRVNVHVGEQIQADDLLLVLEAMKMETNVTAPAAGKVKVVRVNPTDGVKAGQVLVEFE